MNALEAVQQLDQAFTTATPPAVSAWVEWGAGDDPLDAGAGDVGVEDGGGGAGVVIILPAGSHVITPPQ